MSEQRRATEVRRRQRVVLVTAIDEAGIRAALPFAERIAAARGARVHIVHVVPPGPMRLAPMPLSAAGWLLSLGRESGSRTETTEADDIYEAVTLIAPDLDAILAIAATDAQGALSARGRRLVASPPCPLLLLVNAPDAFTPRRILLGTNTSDSLSEDAVELSYAVVNTSDETHVDFLRLLPPEASDEELETISAALHERITERKPPFSFEIVVSRARSPESGTSQALSGGGYDLVILDAPRDGALPRLSERAVPERILRGDTPVMLYSEPAGTATRASLAVWNRVYGAIPTLNQESRVAVYTQVRRNSRGSSDFYVLLALSVLIASFGLLADSAAVVIGAMIVAPLMQPIIGLGMGVATANYRLISLAGRTAVAGILAAVFLGFLAGLVIPGAGITSELDARGQPTLLDLLVALASGAAGAYATARPGAAASAAGVAIAVALVPPLASVGIGLSLGEWPLALGAGLLFLTNLSAISAASTGMFLWLGFKPDSDRFGTRAVFARGIGALVVMIAVVAVSLIGWNRASESRFERQVFDVVETAVQGVDPSAELVGITIDDRDDILYISATVETTARADIATEHLTIQSDVTRELGRPVSLDLLPAP